MTGKRFSKVRSGVRAVVLLTALAAIVCGGLALHLGQDVNFDQQNYHFYAPYALLNDRVLFDIFPAFEGPTYYNPIPFIPFYWLARYAPPKLIGLLLAAAQALVFAPLYLIARSVLPPPLRHMTIAAVPLTALGFGGAIAIAEIGTTFIDNLMAVLALSSVAAAALTMPRLARADLPRAVLCAAMIGVPVGLASGFKLTAAGFAIALALAFLVVPRSWPARIVLVAGAGVGIVFGLLIAGGPWFSIMWAKTGNPVFPYFNQSFTRRWQH